MSEPRSTLVTGASRGIGAGIARLLLDRGGRVAGSYRSGRADVEALAAGHPGRVLPVAFDLAEPATAEHAVEQVRAHWGRLDSLVLNAGVWHGGRLSTMDPDVWWSVVRTNLGGTAALVRAATGLLTEGTQPSIVLVGSVVGEVGFAGDTAYAAGKAALVGFARSLAKELAPDGVRVNVLAPGFVETDMTSAVPDRSRQRIAAATLLGRFGTVDEIARAAVFLADDATFCTGSVLTADGGWSL
ncbi:MULTISPECIES: SDR family NAD(P)-dependent oxidoreductase [Pseudonocardia]|uniref:3-oxoacyl-[acyl-carrier-protein] reductase FabG n=2 Tax=Pseudonocardia TaxID=1847 RepID=A0A1Y2MYM5_PSEAH|nr:MULTISPECIES: SDR family oxidoreductase [Pseudonocardia]OSY40079.1 3-oxoacyl-[acyl-carrier-protein] reductase FabG [Pseudonocardia autotrophica]TDN72975.1 3-oxoacyl-[acyl-carrier protein] reductase [Pseudonocardia autotrophica]BBG03695.1 3-oxoacyl-ACP reductase [Pseudonocardia autotrophica]GEC29216.1 3-oxoacyl-ACP reductase [Pseudonocardia saturnea]